MNLAAIASAIAVAVPLVGAGAFINNYFAKTDDVLVIADRVDKNADSGFRLRQQIINNTRTDREERKLNPDPAWLHEQQKQLDLERCLHQQVVDPKVRCDK
jgi:hypothetical protein